MPGLGLPGILPRCQPTHHRQPGQRFHFLPVDEIGLLPFCGKAGRDGQQASARGPSRGHIRNRGPEPRAGARPLNAGVSHARDGRTTVGPARCPPGADSPQPTGRRRAWASTAFYHAADGCEIARRANVFIFAGLQNRPASVFVSRKAAKDAKEEDRKGRPELSQPSLPSRMSQPIGPQATPATTFVVGPRPGPTRPARPTLSSG